MKLEHNVKLTPAQVAEAFWELFDDEQAAVFIEIDRITADIGWHREMQFSAIGKHLRDCECSTDGARLLVRCIEEGMRADV